ncbi:PIN domain-containing protein [Magnetofaba australis]|uniref:Putative PilT protein domain-containing protein n=1 Tax=Magnetofaba australis IT-1 TaxID=1434232 RepID=A0A1Y2K727_9PROT|nr:type II toxin-antitoxin system VapC family toxin [Magnetofaba australis]OSM06139.1 putative PilT protein domain-containing protein [Magnetofaba australis IT-1]
MIGLDTNVLVRFLTWDEPTQAQQATQYIQQHCTPQTPGRITLIVICELVWVLRSAYEISHGDILDTIERIANAAYFDVERIDLLRAALVQARENTLDLPDCLIALSNQQAGCRHTITLDKHAAKHNPFFHLLS